MPATLNVGEVERRSGTFAPTCLHLLGASSVTGGGGSNTFVRALAKRQTNLGWKSIVVLNQALGDCEAPSPLIASPLDVRMLPPVLGTGRKAYYARRPDAAPGVRELFAETTPAVVHFHTLGLAAGMLHLEAAKAIGARTVVTYHTGGISCPQTGLLENGFSPCDGRLEIARCALAGWQIAACR